MRNLTRLAFAFAAAACGSEEERCDPFLEAMDCVHGQTPVGARRYGNVEGDKTIVPRSPQIGPSAGSANGPGPSPGSANGAGPSPGALDGAGPTAGSAQGSGPSPGSANPADSQMQVEGVAPTCAAYCGAVYRACAPQNPELSDGVAMNLCARFCECFRTIAGECIEAILRIAGPCTERGTCDAIEECLDGIDATFPEPAACARLGDAVNQCISGEEIYDP